MRAKGGGRRAEGGGRRDEALRVFRSCLVSISWFHGFQIQSNRPRSGRSTYGRYLYAR